MAKNGAEMEPLRKPAALSGLSSIFIVRGLCSFSTTCFGKFEGEILKYYLSFPNSLCYKYVTKHLTVILRYLRTSTTDTHHL